MNGIKGDFVKYMSGDDIVSAYLVVPGGKGPFPGVILIHEWWGLNEWIKKKADDFAGQGYVSLEVDLYRGMSAFLPEDARILSSGIPRVRASGDVISAFNYLRGMKEVNRSRIGSIGWYMCGGYSLKTAIIISDLAACVLNYGRLIKETEMLKKINCFILGIFRENDQTISTSDVKEFEEALNEAGIRNKIKIYPDAGHAFMNPASNNLYNRSAAENAWNEIYSFLGNNLMRKTK